MPAPETHLAQHVLRHFRAHGWQAHGQEVVTPDGAVLDLVLRKFQGPMVATLVVECKTGLSLRLLQQTHRAAQYANIAACAVWQSQRETAEGEFAVEVCRRFGFGLLAVGQDGTVAEVVRGRTVDAQCIVGNALQFKPQQEHFAPAGNAEGKRFTAYQEARARVINELTTFAVGDTAKLATVLQRCTAERWRNEVLRDVKAGKIDGVEAYRLSGIWFVRRTGEAA